MQPKRLGLKEAMNLKGRVGAELLNDKPESLLGKRKKNFLEKINS